MGKWQILDLRTRYRSKLGWFFWFGLIHVTIRRNLANGLPFFYSGGIFVGSGKVETNSRSIIHLHMELLSAVIVDSMGTKIAIYLYCIAESLLGREKACHKGKDTYSFSFLSYPRHCQTVRSFNKVRAMKGKMGCD